MDVECVCFGPIREAVGTKTVVQTLESGSTVGDLLTELDRELDGFRGAALTEDGELREEIVVTVDTDNIRQLSGTATTLTDGNTVRITPQIQGGKPDRRPRSHSRHGSGRRRSAATKRARRREETGQPTEAGWTLG